MAEFLITTRLLFCPPNDFGHYEPEDYIQLCKATPIARDALPEYFFNCRHSLELVPPVLYLGWTIGSEADFAEFLRKYDPKLLSFDPTTGELTTSSLFSIHCALRKRFNVSGAMAKLLDVTPVLNEHGEEVWAITVGCNYAPGVRLPDGLIEKIGQAIDKDEPSWWLDQSGWYWQPGDDTEEMYLAQQGKLLIAPHVH
ncbi:hypothetical protein CYLTODRAFT_495348 [Cylindrobasidium torrendii FP15055 ss-10]|uniref:Uncharacterized protein n=1 Tax=Cylindrobasidium torrendii FP15055 ss-10 TaxID=1314674 RepID=A0A0D7ATU0_9AGAR|nr:hypothetical protein CYLTODRAFT_495348 [Cylindrobasidium torrendii FP15055 ss-10]